MKKIFSLLEYTLKGKLSKSKRDFVSGQYPRAGLQDNVLVGAAPYSLSPDLTILPQHLNTRGYQSHAVGKAGRQ